MANQKMLALAFALSMAMAQADSCSKVNAAYKLKATLTNQYCKSSSTAGEGEACEACCEVKPDTCAALQGAGTSCPAATHYANAATEAAATKATFNEKCCTAKKMCDFKCPASHKDKADYKTIKCAGATCEAFECCDPAANTCTGAMTKAAVDGKSCDPKTHVWDGSKGATAVKEDLSDYVTQCCTAVKMCDVTCPNTHKDKTDKATIKCAGATCAATECCDADTTKCVFHVVASGKGCDATKEYVDASKAGNVAKADSSDYKTQCCSTKATCAAFKEAVTSQVSGAAKASQMSAASLLLVAAGALALAK